MYWTIITLRTYLSMTEPEKKQKHHFCFCFWRPYWNDFSSDYISIKSTGKIFSPLAQVPTYKYEDPNEIIDWYERKWFFLFCIFWNWDKNNICLLHGWVFFLSKYLKTLGGRQFTFCNFRSVPSKIMIKWVESGGNHLINFF